MRNLAAILLTLALGLTLVPPAAARSLESNPTRSPGAAPECTVPGAPRDFATALEEFGPGGEPVVTTADEGYWNGRGFNFLFERRDKAAFRTEPGGGYLAGGVVLGRDAAEARHDFEDAIAGWLAAWGSPETVDVAAVGEQTFVARRATPWEVAPGLPMEEVFFAFQFCNSSAHVLVAGMPDLDPVAQARRYAAGIAIRLAARATWAPPPAASPAPPTTAPLAGCSIQGDLSAFAPTIRDFGSSDHAFAVPGRYDYWGGRGYSFGFERASGEGFEASPWGGYLYGGVLRAASEEQARADFGAATASWTRSWDPRATTRVAHAPVGDESIVLTRLTPWEVNLQQPMVEVFVGLRRCDVNVHFIVTVMPNFDPVGQALRYARLVDERMVGKRSAPSAVGRL